MKALSQKVEVCFSPFNVLRSSWKTRIFSKLVSLNKAVVKREMIRNVGKHIIEHDVFFSTAANEATKNELLNLLKCCLAREDFIFIPPVKLKKSLLNCNDLHLMEWLDCHELYDVVIHHGNVAAQKKSLLEAWLLKSWMCDMLVNHHREDASSYVSNYLKKKAQKNHERGAPYHISDEIEALIDRGYIFASQMGTFSLLSMLFHNEDIFEMLHPRVQLRCYEAFSSLRLTAQKALTSQLVKMCQHSILFNLRKHGLKPEWKIWLDGKQTVVALEMLSCPSWVTAMLSSPHIDLMHTNGEGDNLLHLFPAEFLDCPSLRQLLRQRLSELSEEQRKCLLFARNEAHCTPIMKAILVHNQAMVEFLLEFGIRPWDKLKDTDNSALEFLNEFLLCFHSDSPHGMLVEILKQSFWNDLARRWNSEYNYTKLQQSIHAQDKAKKKSKL